MAALVQSAILAKLNSFFVAGNFFNALYLGQYCHCRFQTTTIRTALTSSVD
jgi:hypothetical protein